MKFKHNTGIILLSGILIVAILGFVKLINSSDNSENSKVDIVLEKHGIKNNIIKKELLQLETFESNNYMRLGVCDGAMHKDEIPTVIQPLFSYKFYQRHRDNSTTPYILFLCYYDAMQYGYMIESAESLNKKYPPIMITNEKQ